MTEQRHSTDDRLDAVTLLCDDHAKLKDLFKQFEQAPDIQAKQCIVESACAELEIHSKIEEEIFYPAVRSKLNDDDMVDEAEEEHHEAKGLVDELKAMEPHDEKYDSTFKELCDGVRHHIQEEESEMFPEVKKTDLDLYALGAEMAQRREELWEAMPDADVSGKHSGDKTGRSLNL